MERRLNKVQLFFKKHKKGYYLIFSLIGSIASAIIFCITCYGWSTWYDLFGIDLDDYIESSFVQDCLTGLIIGLILGLIAGIIIKMIIILISKWIFSGPYLSESEEGKSMNGKTSYAQKLMVVSKIIWIIVTLIVGAIGVCVCLWIDDEFILIGAAVGLLVGAFVGFLLNLFMMAFAEMGQNIKRAADNSEKTKVDIPSEIEKYKKLLDNGTISQEEFDAKKNQLINL